MIAGHPLPGVLPTLALALDPFRAIDPRVATELGIVCLGIGAGIASTHLVAVATRRAARSGRRTALLATVVCLAVVQTIRTSDPVALVVTVGSVVVTLALPVAVGVLTVRDLITEEEE